MKVLLHEDLCTDPAGALGEMSEFIGLGAYVPKIDFDGTVRPTESAIRTEARRVGNALGARLRLRGRRRMPLQKLFVKSTAWVEKNLWIPMAGRPIHWGVNPRLADRLCEHYGESNRKFFGMIGKPIEHYDYPS